MPKLIHIFTVLPSPDPTFLKHLNELFSIFLWNHKKVKINRNLLAQDYDKGGLKLTHVQSQVDALKVRWVRYLLLEDDLWVNIFETVTGLTDCSTILDLDPKSLLTIANKIKNTFWREVLMVWSKVVSAYKTDKIGKILNYALWGAWYIKNQNLKKLQIPLSLAGCTKVGDLFDDSSNPLILSVMKHSLLNMFQ